MQKLLNSLLRLKGKLTLLWHKIPVAQRRPVLIISSIILIGIVATIIGLFNSNFQLPETGEIAAPPILLTGIKPTATIQCNMPGVDGIPHLQINWPKMASEPDNETLKYKVYIATDANFKNSWTAEPPMASYGALAPDSFGRANLSDTTHNFGDTMPQVKQGETYFIKVWYKKFDAQRSNGETETLSIKIQCPPHALVVKVPPAAPAVSCSNYQENKVFYNVANIKSAINPKAGFVVYVSKEANFNYPITSPIFLDYVHDINTASTAHVTFLSPNKIRMPSLTSIYYVRIYYPNLDQFSAITKFDVGTCYPPTPTPAAATATPIPTTIPTNTPVIATPTVAPTKPAGIVASASIKCNVATKKQTISFVWDTTSTTGGQDGPDNPGAAASSPYVVYISTTNNFDPANTWIDPLAPFKKGALVPRTLEAIAPDQFRYKLSDPNVLTAMPALIERTTYFLKVTSRTNQSAVIPVGTLECPPLPRPSTTVIPTPISTAPTLHTECYNTKPSIEIGWSDTTRASNKGYVIYIDTDPNFRKRNEGGDGYWTYSYNDPKERLLKLAPQGFTEIETATTNGTGRPMPDLVPNARYYVKIFYVETGTFGPVSSIVNPAQCGGPLHLSPSGTISAGLYTISWNAVGGAQRYALRLHDISGPEWPDNCSVVNPRDICQDVAASAKPTFGKYNFIAGKTYQIWVHSIDTHGVWSDPTIVTVTVTNILAATSTPTPIPTITPTVTLPTFTVTPTPGAVLPPTNLIPSGNLTPAGTYPIKWDLMPGASGYSLRVDDLSNGWTGTCETINPNDVCTGPITTNSFSYDFQAGKTYHIWVHSMDAQGNFVNPATTVTVYVSNAVITTAPTLSQFCVNQVPKLRVTWKDQGLGTSDYWIDVAAPHITGDDFWHSNTYTYDQTNNEFSVVTPLGFTLNSLSASNGDPMPDVQVGETYVVSVWYTAPARRTNTAQILIAACPSPVPTSTPTITSTVAPTTTSTPVPPTVTVTPTSAPVLLAPVLSTSCVNGKPKINIKENNNWNDDYWVDIDNTADAVLQRPTFWNIYSPAGTLNQQAPTGFGVVDTDHTVPQNMMPDLIAGQTYVVRIWYPGTSTYSQAPNPSIVADPTCVGSTITPTPSLVAPVVTAMCINSTVKFNISWQSAGYSPAYSPEISTDSTFSGSYGYQINSDSSSTAPLDSEGHYLDFQTQTFMSSLTPGVPYYVRIWYQQLNRFSPVTTVAGSETASCVAPTATSVPTATPVPTNTAVPTNTPRPTSTRVPGASNTPVPTATSAVTQPSNTPNPVATDTPSVTNTPSVTDTPTATITGTVTPTDNSVTGTVTTTPNTTGTNTTGTPTPAQKGDLGSIFGTGIGGLAGLSFLKCGAIILVILGALCIIFGSLAMYRKYAVEDLPISEAAGQIILIGVGLLMVILGIILMFL